MIINSPQILRLFRKNNRWVSRSRILLTRKKTKYIWNSAFFVRRYDFKKLTYTSVGNYFNEFIYDLHPGSFWKMRFILNDFNQQLSRWDSVNINFLRFYDFTGTKPISSQNSSFEKPSIILSNIRSTNRADSPRNYNQDVFFTRTINSDEYLTIFSYGSLLKFISSDNYIGANSALLLNKEDFTRPKFYYGRAGGNLFNSKGGNLFLKSNPNILIPLPLNKNILLNNCKHTKSTLLRLREVKLPTTQSTVTNLIYFKPAINRAHSCAFRSGSGLNNLKVALYLTRYKPSDFLKGKNSTSILLRKSIFSSECKKSVGVRVREPIKLLELRTALRVPFILNVSGIFLTRRLLLTEDKLRTWAYRFKKLFFSFLQPNQVKKSIMNRQRRIVKHRAIGRFSLKSSSYFTFSYAYFNRFFKLDLLNRIQVNLWSRIDINTTDFFATSWLSPTVNCSTYLGYTESQNELVNVNFFNNKGSDYTFTVGEVRIPRVKFKPGYQRIWRRVRTALKENLNLRFIYQKQLTTYLTRFYWAAKNYSLADYEMALNRVVLYSRLLPDLNSFFLFFGQGWIFLNGRKVLDPKGLVLPNDLIQISVSVWYYIFNRWLVNWTYRRDRRFKRLVFRKGMASRYKLMKKRKTRSNYTPAWIFNVRFDTADVKPHLEVDYFSLSMLVIYDPYVTDYATPMDSADVRVNIYSLYNWKYVN